MLDVSCAAAHPKVAPWAVRVVDQAPPPTAEQLARIRSVFSAPGCPCGCMSAPGRPDPDCARFRPVGVTVDYSDQFEYPVSA